MMKFSYTNITIFTMISVLSIMYNFTLLYIAEIFTLHVLFLFNVSYYAVCIPGFTSEAIIYPNNSRTLNIIVMQY